MNQPQMNAGNVNTSTTMNRPTSAYFNNSNNSNVMNLSSPSTPNIPNSTSNTQQQQQQAQAAMMPFSNAHISHPNLSGMSNASSIANSPITAHRPPMIPNKQQQPGFMREAQAQHSLRMNQQQMMAPSMPNIAHSSGYASNIPASQSMQNVNSIPGGYPIFQQQQHDMPPQQLSPNHHQASLLRGTAKMAEMSEMLKRQQNNQRPPTNGPIHFANSMDNIHIPPPMLSPGAHSRPSAAQVFHPQSPQKQHAPNTAPKPQVVKPQNCFKLFCYLIELFF
jgi:hypothetical protein